MSFVHSIHDIIHRSALSIHRKLTSRLEDAEAQNLLREMILSNDPCMVARFGSVEIQGVINGMLPSPFDFFLKKRTYKYLINNAGFFPVNRDTVSRFSKLILNDMEMLDVLGSWRVEENVFHTKLKNVVKIRLSELVPHPNHEYLSCLQNKKVLIVSPFAELVLQQYQHRREKIWLNTNLLPEYQQLEVVNAVNSIGGGSDYSSWFDALEAMKDEIDRKDFDIALLGCGAYGFPLAAHIKRIGKKAIHMGGSLQLLFGIYGKRWENYPYINDAWIRPRVVDRPKGFENVEKGCYW